MSESESDYVLLKRGLFYRPNAMGYTGIKEHAGRYSKADAESHADPISGVTAMPFDEAPLIAPNCFDDVAVKYLLGCIESRDAVIRALQHTPEPVAWPSREFASQIDILRRASLVPVPDDDTDFDIAKARRGAESWRTIARNVVETYDALFQPLAALSLGGEHMRLRPSASVPSGGSEQTAAPGDSWASTLAKAGYHPLRAKIDEFGNAVWIAEPPAHGEVGP